MCSFTKFPLLCTTFQFNNLQFSKNALEAHRKKALLNDADKIHFPPRRVMSDLTSAFSIPVYPQALLVGVCDMCLCLTDQMSKMSHPTCNALLHSDVRPMDHDSGLRCLYPLARYYGSRHMLEDGLPFRGRGRSSTLYAAML